MTKLTDNPKKFMQLLDEVAKEKGFTNYDELCNNIKNSLNKIEWQELQNKKELTK